MKKETIYIDFKTEYFEVPDKSEFVLEVIELKNAGQIYDDTVRYKFLPEVYNVSCEKLILTALVNTEISRGIVLKTEILVGKQNYLNVLTEYLKTFGIQTKPGFYE